MDFSLIPERPFENAGLDLFFKTLTTKVFHSSRFCQVYATGKLKIKISQIL